jgi:hypothetical protein
VGLGLGWSEFMRLGAGQGYKVGGLVWWCEVGVRWVWDGGERESGYRCEDWDVGPFLASISTFMIIVEKKVTN